jgi:hypothetical protein
MPLHILHQSHCSAEEASGGRTRAIQGCQRTSTGALLINPGWCNLKPMRCCVHTCARSHEARAACMRLLPLNQQVHCFLPQLWRGAAGDRDRYHAQGKWAGHPAAGARRMPPRHVAADPVVHRLPACRAAHCKGTRLRRHAVYAVLACCVLSDAVALTRCIGRSVSRNSVIMTGIPADVCST